MPILRDHYTKNGYDLLYEDVTLTKVGNTGDKFFVFVPSQWQYSKLEYVIKGTIDIYTNNWVWKDTVGVYLHETIYPEGLVVDINANATANNNLTYATIQYLVKYF